MTECDGGGGGGGGGGGVKIRHFCVTSFVDGPQGRNLDVWGLQNIVHERFVRLLFTVPLPHLILPPIRKSWIRLCRASGAINDCAYWSAVHFYRLLLFLKTDLEIIYKGIGNEPIIAR